MCDNIYRVEAHAAGQRLDAALRALFPACSIRARRRLWATHAVLVNGKARPVGWMVYENDEISVRPVQNSNRMAPSADPLPADEAWMLGDRAPYVIDEQNTCIFLYKPAGLHTESLEGRGGPSLEALLPSVYGGAEGMHLVNRLDVGTSGIVAAARTPEGVLAWRRMEDAGLCEKRYLALLCGRMPTAITVRRKLDTAKRRGARVLPVDNTDLLRHTRLTPIGYLSEGAVRELALRLFPHGDWLSATVQYPEYTLAVCMITKGARHQIRAHAAYAGFPLWGDGLYADAADNAYTQPPRTAVQKILLHHTLLSLPGVQIRCPATWLHLLPENLQQSIAEYVYA
ncbi:MAG: pseudouridine synthase [Desulfovibrionaceae bacterium]